MCSLNVEAATLRILAACEAIARSLWPELFEDGTTSPPETAENDPDSQERMTILQDHAARGFALASDRKV